MAQDPFVNFKSAQREGWALFAPVEILTTLPAGHLVAYAQINRGEKVLDVGCGTGVIALTAAQRGAKVRGIDLTPALLERAKANAALAEVEIEFREGDVEALPYKDGEFDVVLSQFGHMFAPRPEVAISEMLRVLRPGGRIAFSTWPPELFTGRMFALTGKYLPPPEGVAPPPLWGDPKIVRERLGTKVSQITFEREILFSPALSPKHVRNFFETTVGPLTKLVKTADAAQLNTFRSELEQLITEFTRDNHLRQHFLMTRATKI